jgi:hypothetical protein
MADMFRGEETGNAAFLDLGKVQMFFFTIIDGGVPIHEFPALDESIVALLGISHATFLTYQAVPHSQSKKPGEEPQTA